MSLIHKEVEKEYFLDLDVYEHQRKQFFNSDILKKNSLNDEVAPVRKKSLDDRLETTLFEPVKPISYQNQRSYPSYIFEPSINFEYLGNRGSRVLTLSYYRR